MPGRRPITLTALARTAAVAAFALTIGFALPACDQAADADGAASQTSPANATTADSTEANTEANASADDGHTAGDAHSLFTDLSYADARSKANEEGKLFVVKATAVWCGPCKLMEKTTWVDENVVAFVNDNVIAYSLDVDKEPAIKQQLGIRAMPTIVVFEDGEEKARVIGYQDAENMLAWLQSLRG